MTAVDLPISIGLVGAPGSGKQEIAQHFYDIAEPWFKVQASELRVIENAGSVIEREYDQAMGVFGSWQEDLRAYFLRNEMEVQARKDGVSFLSLGTAVENIAHCGVNMETIAMGISTPEQQPRMQRQQVAMTTLTFLFLQNFRYLFGFYVPSPTATIILPGVDDSERSYSQRIDNGIRSVFGNFAMKIQMLDQPSIEEKAEVMFNTVRDIVENGIPEPTTEEVPPQADVTLAE